MVFFCVSGGIDLRNDTLKVFFFSFVPIREQLFQLSDGGLNQHGVKKSRPANRLRFHRITSAQSDVANSAIRLEPDA